MRVMAPSPSPFFATVLIMSCLLLASCSTPTARHSQADSDVVRIPESWKPHLLYLLPSPHPRLYVEVDAVEGCVPKQAALEKLRDFLSAYCNKPDGIEIVRSDVIPIKAARGISPRALARKYMNGPDKITASPPAFMYVLFYNYALCGDSVVAKARHPGASKAPTRRPKVARIVVPRNPYAEVLPYPTIYFNPRYFLGMAKKQTLLHETGHLLGMVSRPTHAREGHCLDPACLMNARLRPYRWLLGKWQKQLCRQCVAELEQSSMQPSPSNLRFVGSVPVRSEVDYHVFSLPARLLLLVGDFSDERCANFADRVHAEAPGADGRSRVICLARSEVLDDRSRVNEIIDRFKNDAFEVVRRDGPKALLRACVGRYESIGQYSNVVAVLHKAILFDPNDDSSYNQLAWIKATCSDTSVRNGKEAVSAASKACELTQWKDWEYIDTLAAACAEAGDFKRAIEFQEQALCTGNPTESEQKVMRERVSLYKQSQPFRENSDKP